MITIKVRHQEPVEVNVGIHKPIKIEGEPGSAGAGMPKYEGEYEVNPDFSTQILQTKNKAMRDDVTVHPIEVQRVSNAKGGKTVYIGGII